MASKVGSIPLRNLSVRITKGTTPTRGEGFVSRGINYVKSEAITPNGTIDTSKFAQIDEATHNALGRSQLRVGNVLFSMAGVYLGKTAVVQPEHVPANTNQAVGIITIDEDKADPRFIHYSIQSPACRAWILNSAAQSAQPNFNLKEIGDLPIPRYKLEEQRAIAHILGTLDDKIELNRRRNQTLEAMARALFKDWFVDFGPVRTKMEGREPYLPADLWQHFPDHLDDEGKPEGWDIRPLNELLTIIGGGTPKTSVEDYWDGEIPWFSVVDTPSASDVFVVATEKTITAQGLSGSSARLIPKGTTIISARGTVGNLAIAGREMTFNQSCYGLRGTGVAGDYFVYLTAQQMVDQLKSMAHGSVFSTITRQTFEAIQRPVPPPCVLTAFEGQISGWFDVILSSVEESQTLAQLRDTLLPKLISGELRITDAENFIERVESQAPNSRRSVS